MKKTLIASVITFMGFVGVANAATVDSYSMEQNQWIIFDISEKYSLNVSPVSKDGSFSYTYAFGDKGGCGSNKPHDCIPSAFNVGSIQNGYSHNFGETWYERKSQGSITSDFSVNLNRVGVEYLYFRVTSGKANIDVVGSVQPAPVPLPATGLLLASVMGVGYAFSRKKKNDKNNSR